jgi:hypothetical protein
VKKVRRTLERSDTIINEKRKEHAGVTDRMATINLRGKLCDGTDGKGGGGRES